MTNILMKAFLFTSFTTASLTTYAMGNKPENPANKGEEVNNVKVSGAPAISGREGFSKIVKPLLPCVVNISTSKDVKVSEMPGFEVPHDSPLGDIFKHFFKEYNKQQRRPQKSRALGSGFIIGYNNAKHEAYIVTNNHIIAEADEILVKLADETTVEFKAEVVGKDARTDIALLKIKSPEKLPILEWGDSEKAQVGEWAIAIGNPFGLGSTVTSGIISTKGRELPIADYVVGYIQTDASINMGNSGGPLFNIDGQVIGINTAILAPNGGNIGIGFAIPSNIARKVINQLLEMGHTRRGWLGAAIQPITKEIAESVGREKSNGALVAKVFDKSPAKEAGIERGDIILKFNGQEVKNSQHLPGIVGETEIGKEVDVIIWRDEKELKKTLKVGEFEKAEEAGLIEMKSSKTKMKTNEGIEVMGMTLHALDDALRQHHGLDDKVKGVVIIDIDNDSEAARRGLEPGDVIAEVGRKEVFTPDDIKTNFDEARKKNRASTLLLINRRGELRFLTLATNEDEKNESQKKSNQSNNKTDRRKNSAMDTNNLTNDDTTESSEPKDESGRKRKDHSNTKEDLNRENQEIIKKRKLG